MLLGAQVVLLSLFFFYWFRANDWLRHTEHSISKIHELERVLVNMQSGFRGYLLTNDATFLAPFNAAKGSVERTIFELRKALADNATQLQRIDSIESLVRQWLERKDDGDPKSIASMNARKDLIDIVRQRMQEMVLTESQLKVDQYDRERRAAITGVVGGIGVSLLLGVALALVNRRTVIDLSSAYQRSLDEETATNKQFYDLAESVPQLIWITDGGGKSLYFNRTWSEFAGVTGDELTAKGWGELLHPEDQTNATEKWTQSLANGTPFESEYRLRRGCDGAYRWFLCRAVAVLDKAGKSTRWFGSCTDIDNQKQIDREREALLAVERQARSDLIRTGRVKDEFLATLSHELRTPMTAIIGWSRLLRDPAMREKNLDRGIEAIDASAKAQARLIDDLLDMNRILAGKLLIKPEPTDLRAIVRAAADAIVPAANNKKISFALDLDRPQPIMLNGDPARLQQVVWNLLTNAVKFTPNGGTVTVTLRVLDDGSAARLTVADTGLGIKPSFLPHMFERFRQADGSTTRQQGGLGLGLAIARNLVEMHGGIVTAASEGEGHGAAFTVELPLGSPSHPPIVSDDNDDAALDCSVIRDQSVLVVDDDHETAGIIRTILEHAGATVHVALSAAEALQQIRLNEFDLLISDIGMPTMDGYALIREVRKHEYGSGRRMRAMALTAFARSEDRDLSLAAGFDRHMAKPILPGQLLQAVAQVVTTA